MPFCLVEALAVAFNGGNKSIWIWYKHTPLIYTMNKMPRPTWHIKLWGHFGIKIVTYQYIIMTVVRLPYLYNRSSYETYRWFLSWNSSHSILSFWLHDDGKWIIPWYTYYVCCQSETAIWISELLTCLSIEVEYRKVSNIRRTKPQNLNASRLIL